MLLGLKIQDVLIYYLLILCLGVWLITLVVYHIVRYVEEQMSIGAYEFVSTSKKISNDCEKNDTYVKTNLKSVCYIHEFNKRYKCEPFEITNKFEGTAYSFNLVEYN